mgnify:FL=1
MATLYTPRSGDYSLAERRTDAAVHLIGLAAALAAVPVLIVLAARWHGNMSVIAGVSVYGASLIAMIGASALYHMVPHPRWRGLFRRLDHAAIYVKIAGTYTPFAALSGGAGAGLVTGLWGAALAGVSLWVFAPGRFRWAMLALYLGMGWAGLAAGGALLATLSPPVFWLIVAGGVTYTLGVIFFLCERMPFHNTIWHVFVFAATVTFFIAVAVHLAATSVPVPHA